jgi:hypothetical protein
MSEDDNPQGRARLTRREFLTNPLACLDRELRSGPSAATARLDTDGELVDVPGRIPLSALGQMSPDSLMPLVPVLRYGWTAQIGEEGIAYRNTIGQDGFVELDSAGCAAVRLFDGVRTIEQVAGQLQSELGMPAEDARSMVRQVFVTLVERQVYHPGDSGIPPTEPTLPEG